MAEIPVTTVLATTSIPEVGLLGQSQTVVARTIIGSANPSLILPTVTAAATVGAPTVATGSKVTFDIVLDAAVESIRTITGTPWTWTHTPVDPNPKAIIVTEIHPTSALQLVSSVTYGGVTMTLAASRSQSIGSYGDLGRASVWYLTSGIPPGPQTVSVTLTGDWTTDFQFTSMSFTAPAPLALLGTQTALNGSSVAPTRLLTAPEYNGYARRAIIAMFSGLSSPSSLTPPADVDPVHDYDFGSQSARVDIERPAWGNYGGIETTTFTGDRLNFAYTAAPDAMATVVAGLYMPTQPMALAKAVISSPSVWKIETVQAKTHIPGKWQYASAAAFMEQQPGNVAYANGYWAAGGYTYLGVTTDPMNTAAWVAPTHYANTGGDQTYSICSDGATWLSTTSAGLQTVAHPPTDPWVHRSWATAGLTVMRESAVGGGTWVMVGDAGAIATATDPASTWTLGTSSFGTSTIWDVATNGTHWVAVGNDGKIATATDPTGTWTQRANPLTGAISFVTYLNGYWFVSGFAGAAYATDPTGTWTQFTLPGLFTGYASGAYARFAYDGEFWYGFNSFVDGEHSRTTDPTGTWESISMSGQKTEVWDVAGDGYPILLSGDNIGGGSDGWFVALSRNLVQAGSTVSPDTVQAVTSIGSPARSAVEEAATVLATVSFGSPNVSATVGVNTHRAPSSFKAKKRQFTGNGTNSGNATNGVFGSPTKSDSVVVVAYYGWNYAPDVQTAPVVSGAGKTWSLISGYLRPAGTQYAAIFVGTGTGGATTVTVDPDNVTDAYAWTAVEFTGIVGEFVDAGGNFTNHIYDDVVTFTASASGLTLYAVGADNPNDGISDSVPAAGSWTLQGERFNGNLTTDLWTTSAFQGSNYGLLLQTRGAATQTYARAVVGSVTPVVVSGAQVGPSTVQATTSIGTPALLAAEESDTVTAITTVGAPTVLASSTVQPTTVLATTTIESSLFTVVEAATVEATATVGTVTVEAGSTVTPATVAAATTVGAPTFTSDVTVTPGSVQATTSVPSPTLPSGANVAATTVQAVGTVGAPTVGGNANIAAAVVQAVATIGTAVPSADSFAAVNTVQAVTAISTPAAQAGSVATPATVLASIFIAEAAVQGSAATVTGTVSIGYVTVEAGSTVLAATVAVTTSVGTPTVQVGSGETVTPQTVTVSVTVPLPALFSHSLVQPGTVTVQTAIAAPLLTAFAQVLAQTVEATATVGAVTVTTRRTPFRGWGVPIR